MKVVILTSILCASTLFSANNPSNTYSYEVTPFVSGILSDSKAGLNDDNYINGGIALGKNLDDSFIDQIEIAYMRSNSLEYEGSNGNTNINRAFLNAVKKFAFTDKFATYSILGAGYQNVTQELNNNVDSPFVNYGLGLRYDLPYYGIAVKSDVRHLITTKNNQNQVMYTLGLAMPLGKKYNEVIAPTIPIIKEEFKPAIIVKEDIPTAITKYDDDNDGVINKLDKCPNTSAGIEVNKDGCVETIDLNINFDTNSTEIRSIYKDKIKSFANLLKENSTLSVVIEAHTDSKGSDSYNKTLSDRRAISVVNELKKLNINPSRLKAIGYGESQPIASNEDEKGKATNRRVTALVNQ